MTPTLDWLLRRLVESGTTLWDVVAVLLPIALVLAIALWVAVERRSRSLWQKTPRPVGPRSLTGGGPYRQATLDRFFPRAPVLLRVVSLAGIVVGVVGILWPVLLVAEIRDVRAHFDLFVLLELVGAAAAIFSLTSGIAIVYQRGSLQGRNAGFVPVLPALAGTLSVLFLLGAFDGLDIEVHGIKWQETMKLRAFLSADYAGLFRGHFGLPWRIMLRTLSVYGIASSLYFVAWARAVAYRQEAQKAQTA
jgi:hypothetical protein